MRSRTAGALALVLSVGASCGGERGNGPGEPRPVAETPATASLWALAPADAAFGLVLADGAGQRWLDTAADIEAVVRAHPLGERFAAQARAALAEDAAFDVLDPAAWTANGFDLARGAALFVDADEEIVMVLPVADRARFRALAEGTVDADAADVDRFSGDTVCLAAGERYLCSEHLELAALRALARPHASQLATRVAALPAELRGDAELVADLSQFPEAVRALDALRPALAGVQLGVLALRLEGGAASLRGWLQATRSGPIGAAFAALPPPSESFSELGTGAVGAVRVRAPVLAAIALNGESVPPLPFAGVDVSELFVKKLTGELALYTGGRAGLALIAVGASDTEPLAAALPQLCAEAGTRSGIEVDIGDARCRANVPLELGDDPSGLLPKTADLALEVTDAGLVYRLSDPPAEAPPPRSRWARALLDGRWHLALWSRSLDPLATSSAELGHEVTALLEQHLEGEQREAVGFARWLLGQVHEAGLAGALHEDGFHLSARVVTYGADPAPARAAYRAALGKLLAGDDPGYRAAMVALAAEHPDTLAGAQAILVGQAAPGVGASTGLFAVVAIPALSKYLARSRGAARSNQP